MKVSVDVYRSPAFHFRIDNKLLYIYYILLGVFKKY